MFKKTALAVCAASLCVAGATAPAAFATSHVAQKVNKPHMKITPSKNVKSGTTQHLTATGALKKTQYYCIYTTYHKGITLGATTADTGSIKTVTSSASGVVKCANIFLAFKGTYKGKAHSCPASKADKKAGWGCGLALADVKTHSKKSFGIALFTTK